MALIVHYTKIQLGSCHNKFASYRAQIHNPYLRFFTNTSDHNVHQIMKNKTKSDLSRLISSLLIKSGQINMGQVIKSKNIRAGLAC